MAISKETAQSYLGKHVLARCTYNGTPFTRKGTCKAIYHRSGTDILFIGNEQGGSGTPLEDINKIRKVKRK